MSEVTRQRVVYAAHCGRISAQEGEYGTELIFPVDSGMSMSSGP